MSYTPLSPQPPGLAPGEVAVQLSNCIVAVRSVVVQGGDGFPIATAYVRVINADGSPYKDSHGQPVTTVYSVSVTRAVASQCVSLRGVQKCVLMLALGEGYAPFVPPIQPAAGIDIVSRMKLALDLAVEDTAALL